MNNQKQKPTIPKKITEKLSKFSYYTNTLLPSLFEQLKEHQNNLANNTIQSELKKKYQNKLLTKQPNNNIIYNYFYSSCQNTSAINQNSILSSVKKLYLNHDVIKINNISYSRENLFKESFLPVYGLVSEIVDFVLVNDTQQKNIGSGAGNNGIEKNNVGKSHGTGDHHVKNAKTLAKPKQYWLYVIHNCNNNTNNTQNISESSLINPTNQYKKITWEYFIERYHFIDKNIAVPQSSGIIEYELIYSYKSQSSNFLSLNFEQKLTKSFLKSHCKISTQQSPDNITLQTLQKLQGYLLQQSQQVSQHLKQQNDIAFSDQHRRQSKIPIQYYKHYLKLKHQIYKIYQQLHNLESQQQINKYFYQNLICRYLIAKQYHFQESKKCIVEYLKWQKQLQEKYKSLEDFKEIHQIGAYRYIGEDFMGRPVILNKGALVDVTKMETQEKINKYCDYYIYFLEIYLRTKMRGYVDQMVIIADLENLGAKNFKLAITKRNVGDSLKYGPERQLGLTAINVSSFAYPIWTFIKPLLPKKTLSKIEIIGNNKKDIVKTLTQKMDIKIIPSYLGGENNNIYSDLQGDKFSNEQSNNPTKKSQNAQNEPQQSSFIKKSSNSNNKFRFQGIELVESVFHMKRQQDQDQISQQIQITSVKSYKNNGTIDVVNQKNEKNTKPQQQNALFNLFTSVTKTLGIKFN